LITRLRPVPRLRRNGAIILYFSVAQHPKSPLGRLNVEVYRSHTPGKTTLNRRSVLHTGHYPRNTQQTQEKNTHAFSGVRIRDPSNRVALDMRLRRSYTSTPPYALMVWRGTTLPSLVTTPCSLESGDQHFGITCSLRDQCRRSRPEGRGRRSLMNKHWCHLPVYKMRFPDYSLGPVMVKLVILLP